MERGDEADDELEEVIDAEVVDEQPRRCPSCESFDVERGKNFAAYAVVMVATLGAAVAIDQMGAAFLALIVLLVVYYVMPPYRCQNCGARFD